MICEDKVDKYCRQAITYEKYVKYRGCNKCCISCIEPCGNLCFKVLEHREKQY